MKQSRVNAAPAAASNLGFRADVDAPISALAEVWGDTVDLKHLAWSVVLGVAISVGAFEAGKAMLPLIVRDPAIVRAYAMLIGLAGCLIAGALSAFLFRPKRVVVDYTVDDADRMDVLNQLAEERGGIGSISDLSASAKAELKELGLFGLFASYERSRPTRRAGEH